MKHIVISEDYEELDFKPKALLQQYLTLLENDVTLFLNNPAELRDDACPGCRSVSVSSRFKRYGFSYAECGDCGTLYVTPRPDDLALRRYYKESSAARFWRNELSRRTSQSRKAKIIKPRMRWVVDSVLEYHPEAEYLVDINTNHTAYVEELKRLDSFKRKTLIDPFVEIGTSFKSIDIFTFPLGDASFEEVDVITLFEVTDRTADVERLFEKVDSMLRPGGLCFLTAILSSGFDIQILWDRAPNLYPPDRLNVCSVEGLKKIFRRHGFECLELSTPGMLDIANVDSAWKQDSSTPLPRFVRYLLTHRDQEVRMAFQEFLQSSLLSSYSRVVLRKV